MLAYVLIDVATILEIVEYDVVDTHATRGAPEQ